MRNLPIFYYQEITFARKIWNRNRGDLTCHLVVILKHKYQPRKIEFMSTFESLGFYYKVISEQTPEGKIHTIPIRRYCLA